MASNRKVSSSELPPRRSHRLINRSHRSRYPEISPLLSLPLPILFLCVDFAMVVKGEWGTHTFVADFGITARVCRTLLRLTKDQHFLESLYARGLNFREPVGRVDLLLRRQMGKLILDSMLETVSGAPSWGELQRSNTWWRWQGCLKAPATSPFASADVAVRIFFGDDYPWQPPKVYFDSRVFHPNINAHGRLRVPFLTSRLPGWNPSGCLISLMWNIIAVLSIPHVPEGEDDDNEAMHLYIECPKKYHTRAEELYNEDEPVERPAGVSDKRPTRAQH